MNQAAEEKTMAAAVVRHAGTSSVLDVGRLESWTRALRLIYASYQEMAGRLFLALQVIN